MKSGFSLPSSLKRCSEKSPLPRPVRLMVFKYCLGMIMSVAALMIYKGAATPSRVVNFSIDALPVNGGQGVVVYRECDNRKRANSAELVRGSLDRLHICVRQPKMVADLVDQDVADDVAQRLFMLGPVIQDRGGTARSCWGG